MRRSQRVILRIALLAGPSPVMLAAVVVVQMLLPRWAELPTLTVLAAAVVWGTDWFVRARPARIRRGRRERGECLHCGYNLTGNVSGACPECGERTAT